MKRLFIDGTGGKKWIGGLYYKKNIIFSLLENQTISSNVKIFIATEKENEELFTVFGDAVEVKTLKYNSEKGRKIKLLLMAILSRADYIFPSFGKIFQYFGIEDINWIADFQHDKFPEFFSEEEIRARNSAYKMIAERPTPLVLSSNDSLNDFITFYGRERKNVFVVPFVSYIEPDLKVLSAADVNGILDKFGLSGKQYACVMNQFWKHKNHMVVFHAIQEYFKRDENSSFIFVFTGKMEDYRNPDYIESLKQIISDPLVENHIRLLGFMERKEQIAVMKAAEFVIQPSLFEGWGTVLEDAKVLDKQVVLSDIAIHREQKNEKCILFNPYDSHELSLVLETECAKTHVSDINSGIRSMHDRALQYSKGFERMILERK